MHGNRTVTAGRATASGRLIPRRQRLNRQSCNPAELPELTMQSGTFPGHGIALPRRRAFTLLEIIVVVGIVTVLLGIMLPGLSQARHQARQTACIAGLQQLGVAVATYAMDNEGYLPYGPKAPPPSATNFYPATGNVTSLISLQNGAPVGLGLLLENQLSHNKEVLFCPGADETWDTKASLAAVGKSQVEASYYYRHASVTTLSGPLSSPNMQIDRLGRNRRGGTIRCLAFDTQFLAPAKMALFNLRTRTHHRQRLVNALYTDGHASEHRNFNGRFTVNVSISVYQTLDRILKIFEELDQK
jgi:prepilin-type N-terminal cleavage/methylation domain-containing protein/prepilin-type processing-associated H-X9-DG protein